MNPVAARHTPTTDQFRQGAEATAGAESWSERSGRLYRELERPARSMLRRAFRGAFDDAEVEDIYATAWLGTLRALERRHADLGDDEIRSYLLTAVAHQATRELRRRSRRPTAPLEAASGFADGSSPPDEQAASLEQSRIARDVLGTLPPRRRAVMLFRYGWGLEPGEVCRLVEGLSPRAYRKEITRGVEELTEKLRLVERGDWCEDREPVLKAYAAGLADAEQARQAEHHLAHCRHCAEFVGKLSGHLYDLGSAAVVTEALHAIDGRTPLAERALAVLDQAREAVGRALGRGGSEAAEAATGHVVASGGPRGVGAAGAGAVAKLAGLGMGAKGVLAVCGVGAAATACVVSGVIPGVELPGTREQRERGSPAEERPGDPGSREGVSDSHGPGVPPAIAPPPPAQPEPSGTGEGPVAPQPEPEPAAPPPPKQEFGPVAAQSKATTTTSASGTSPSDAPPAPTGSPEVQEFGP